MGEISDNVKRVLERVREAERAAGVPEGTVTVVGASKQNGAEAVREAYAAGLRAFGENRVQELVEKRALGAYEGAELHFIGHLQRNKINKLVGAAGLIESADSEELLAAIGRRAREIGIKQRVLIEVNIGREAGKSGVAPEELPELWEKADGIDGILAQGIMAIPPVSANISETARYFKEMRKLFVDISAKKYDNSKTSVLSMGMSADFEEAIRAGANMVRIGSAIFGERVYPRGR